MVWSWMWAGAPHIKAQLIFKTKWSCNKLFLQQNENSNECQIWGEVMCKSPLFFLSCCTVSVGFSMAFSLDVLVSLLRQENAVDICVIKIPENIQYADYLIVVSGISTRHLRAMALYATKVVRNDLMKLFQQSIITDVIFKIVKHILSSSSTNILRKRKSQMSRLKERTQRTGCALTLVCKLQECQFFF